MLSYIKENKDYKINSFNVNSIIIFSTFGILLMFLSNVLLFDDMPQIWADSVIATINVGDNPWIMAYNSANNNMYVTNFGSNIISVINSNNEVITTINVGFSPQAIAYNSANNDMYFANYRSNTVSVINSNNQLVATIDVGSGPKGIAYNSANNNMYVSNYRSNTVSVINSNNQLVATMDVGTNPYASAYNSANNNMYVSNYGSNTVSVINTSNHKVVATIPVGLFPLNVAYNSFNHDMYVDNSGSNTVSVINSNNEVITTINVGFSPQGIAYNSANNNMYVSNYRSNTVSVINTSNNTVVATIPVGPFPQAIAYNSANHDMYVANFGSNTVSVIATNTPVHPPSGTTITLAADGNGNTVQNQSSTVSTSITFQVTATKGTNPLAGFQCSLDSIAYEPCTVTDSGLITYNNLAAGQQHTFKVRAVDTHGNVDPLSSTFIWTDLITSPSNNSTTPINGNSSAEFSSHGGNSIAITGSANGGDGILKGIGGNGGHSGSATSTAGNVVNGNSWHTGENNNP